MGFSYTFEVYVIMSFSSDKDVWFEKLSKIFFDGVFPSSLQFALWEHGGGYMEALQSG